MNDFYAQELLNSYIDTLPKEVSPSIKEEIRKSSQTIILAKGETMFCGGSRRNMIHHILKGSCVRYVTNDEGVEKAIMFHTEDFIPAFGAPFTRREGSSVSSIIKASEQLYLLEMSQSAEQALAARDHAYAIYIINLHVEAIGKLNQFQNHLLGLSKTNLLIWLLNEYSYLFQRFPSKDIANFMGVSPVWLSNLKRKIIR